MSARVVAVGFFDGVHAGHRRILAGADLAITFRNHPATVLRPESAPPLLMSPDDRLAEMSRCGVREVVALDFTPELAATPPEDFIPRLGGAETVRCGANWRFGRGGAGDAAFLRSRGFRVETVPYETAPDGGIVSSTRIREALSRGDVEGANAMLGREWTICGRTASGKGVGASLGFPTVNVLPDPALVRPPAGVYLVRACGADAIANYGTAPTFGDRAWKTPVLEVHFASPPMLPATGTEMRVSFLRFIRQERTFPSAAALKEQIAADVAAAFGRPR